MLININDKLNKIFDNKKNIKRIFIQEAFGIVCEKIVLDNKKIFVLKYYKKQIDKNNFNALKAEVDSLHYLRNSGFLLFPNVIFSEDELIILEFIDHENNVVEVNNTNFLDIILAIHQKNSKYYGFSFDSQIGAMKQPNDIMNDWSEFFQKNRIEIVYDAICKVDPLPKELNIKIEKLILQIKNLLPQSPKPSLLHGDLWKGNILFKNNKVVGLIDPGIFFGHNEMELAYLRFFNFADESFLKRYSSHIALSSEYFLYEPIYQLYYCLLNVYLWSREYIKNTYDILKKIKI